jgi:hypothetical protein
MNDSVVLSDEPSPAIPVPLTDEELMQVAGGPMGSPLL